MFNMALLQLRNFFERVNVGPEFVASDFAPGGRFNRQGALCRDAIRVTPLLDGLIGHAQGGRQFADAAYLFDRLPNRSEPHMPRIVASIPCCRKRNLPEVLLAREACTFRGVEKETIGARIKRLRTATGWTRPELGRKMGAALERKPFSGELIRLYELDVNRPGADATKALASVFGKSEQFIVFGESGRPDQSPAEEKLARDELELLHDYRKASDGWRLTLRLMARTPPEDQPQLSKNMNILMTTIFGKAADDKRVAKAIGPLPSKKREAEKKR